MENLRAIVESSLFQRAASALGILVIGTMMIRIVMRILQKSLEKSHLEKAAHRLITSLVRVSMGILLALIAASSLGVDVTSIVALASVLTLALSLALQNMVSNILGGFTILYTQPFHSGDYVEIAGQGGTVTEINMTYTLLSTPDNKQIAIPNSSVVAAQIVNYSAAATRRVEVAVSVSYAVPTRKVMDALTLAGAVEGVLPEPAPMAVITGYGEGAVQYSLRLWVKTETYWDVYFLVNQRVKTIFDEQGIEMAYSHVQVHMKQA